jgi:hypothetical protein
LLPSLDAVIKAVFSLQEKSPGPKAALAAVTGGSYVIPVEPLRGPP